LELCGTEGHPKFWGLTTLSFSISQVVGAYFMSVLLHYGYNYVNCFVISTVAFFAGLAVVCVGRSRDQVAG
jgi:hypothetical protein